MSSSNYLECKWYLDQSHQGLLEVQLIERHFLRHFLRKHWLVWAPLWAWVKRSFETDWFASYNWMDIWIQLSLSCCHWSAYLAKKPNSAFKHSCVERMFQYFCLYKHVLMYCIFILLTCVSVCKMLAFALSESALSSLSNLFFLQFLQSSDRPQSVSAPDTVPRVAPRTAATETNILESWSTKNEPKNKDRWIEDVFFLILWFHNESSKKRWLMLEKRRETQGQRGRWSTTCACMCVQCTVCCMMWAQPSRW